MLPFFNIDSIFVAGQFPSDHVALSIVLGGFSIVILRAQMDDFDDFIDKDDDFFLQTLGSVREKLDTADGKGYFDFLSRQCKVDTAVGLGQTVLDN